MAGAGGGRRLQRAAIKEKTAIITNKVTAGRDETGAVAPKFAERNDDVLFGQFWARGQQLSPRDRRLVDVCALTASGSLDSSLPHHIQKAAENGITAQETAEPLTHLAFYAGWPQARAALRMVKAVFTPAGEQPGRRPAR